MLRAALVLLLSAALGAADDASLYLPVKVGAKRVLEVTVGEKRFDVTETVKKVESKDGIHTVTVANEDANRPGKAWENVFEVSAEGVVRTSNREKEGEPLPLLKVGLKKGDTWTADQFGPGGEVGAATYTLGGAEDVTVPAGAY